jgi:hypothetical protein
MSAQKAKDSENILIRRCSQTANVFGTMAISGSRAPLFLGLLTF